MDFEGIVLSSVDYKENSKIVSLYTKMGKMSIRANGAKTIKKGLLGFITTGNIVSFLYTNSKYPSVMEYSVIEEFYPILYNIEKIKAFSSIIELLTYIPDDINHERYFEYAKKTLINLKGDCNLDKLVCSFYIKSLINFGVSPNLKTCIRCGRSNVIFLSLPEGGALCDNCTINNNIDLSIWYDYYYSKKDIDLYLDCDFNILKKQIKDYYLNFANIRLKNI